jgi:beta propeller repeat protein
MKATYLIALTLTLGLGFWGDAPAWAITDFPIAVGGVPQKQSPDVSGNIVVWQQGPFGSEDIYGKNLTTGVTFPIATGSVSQYGPRIDGDVVTWTNFSEGFPIYWKNLTTGVTSNFSTKGGGINFIHLESEAISGNIMVYEQLASSRDYYGLNLLTRESFPICTNNSDQFGGRIDGDKVVWYDNRTGENKIYGKNLTSGIESALCNTPGSQSGPDISGNLLVWMDQVPGSASGDYDIYGKNLTTGIEFPVCTAPGFQSYPAISGNFAVWVDNRRGTTSPYDLYAKDLSTNTEFLVCSGTVILAPIAIDGNLVTWVDNRNGHQDIYGAYIPEPATLSLLALGSLAALRRRG